MRAVARWAWKPCRAGALSCLSVEQNAAACRAIRDNIKVLGWSERARVWQNSVKSAMNRLTESDERFDLVLADPPFHRATELPELCALLDKGAQLLHNVGKPFPALLVLQHHWKAEPQLQAFTRVGERRAGESRLSFYELSSDESHPKLNHTLIRVPDAEENPDAQGEARP
jgi:16S rRNA (guanine966-N2)-methyltransferase